MSNAKKNIGTFLLGLIVGGALGYAGFHFCAHFPRGPHFWKMRQGPKPMIEMFTRKLDLNPEQKAKVEKVLDAKLAELRELRARTHPQFKAVMDAGNAEIRGYLEPGQKEKFDKMIQDFERRREEDEKRMEAPR